MSETKFTPGPWNRGVCQNVYQGERWDPTNKQRMIASCEPTTRTQEDWEETWANASLIAAAPELLAALELCLKNSEFRRASGVESGPMIEREIEVARAAVNKAKGA